MRLNSPQINIITKACMKASRSLIRDFGEIENLQDSSKGPGDFVTSADKRTEKIIIQELQKAHPDYGIITEESEIINKANTDNRWIIDPIDGTKALIAGQPTWSNLISLYYNNEPVFGMANFPVLNKIYYGDRFGSYLIEKKKTRIQSSKLKYIKKSIMNKKNTN